jgi:type IV pilus biogenesis protein CpaD/CtpE
MNTASKGLLVLASLMMLSACDLRLNEHVMKAREVNDLRQANRVDMVQFKHQVNFDGGRDLPTDAEYDRFDKFIDSIQLGYGDEVTLVGGARYRREAMAAYLERLGLPVTIKLEAGTTEERAVNTVQVAVNRYVVTPPACPNWSNFDGDENRNTPGSNYGCAVDASLGYMVANPRDLVQGQTPGPALGVPLIEANKRYQQGKVKVPASTGTGG